MQKSVSKNILIAFVILAISGLAGASILLYRQIKNFKSNPEQLSQKENQEVVSAVGKLVLLPDGETPTIATVTDPEKLKTNQAFFAKAAIGDKVLIYTRAFKAIMYRPNTNKIIEMAPIVVGETANATTVQNTSD